MMKTLCLLPFGGVRENHYPNGRRTGCLVSGGHQSSEIITIAVLGFKQLRHSVCCQMSEKVDVH
jgi:hypothetical protein